MKRYLCAFLVAATLLVAMPAISLPQTNDLLTNEAVIKMIKDGLSPEIVVAKIKTSRSNFDTSGDAMNSLKLAGVPDAVILAMVNTGTKPAPAMPPTSAELVEASSSRSSLPATLPAKISRSATPSISALHSLLLSMG